MVLPREIKFRFWNIFQHKWEDLEKRHYTGFSAQDHFDELFDESNIVPQQYTGEKDSLGRDIYEGDILRFEVGGNTLVKWTEERMDWTGWVLSDLYTQGGARTVIGNIFENPELDYYGKKN